MKKWILAAAISAALFGCAGQQQAETTLPAGVTLLESVSFSGQDVGIPYRKYELANGLTVILHEDHSDPLVHVDVTYHVGSGRELVGRSGFAHLFEHMMFQGSEHVADEQHFKMVTEAGGNLNGTTNTDRTNYFETVPNNQLEKMLWLESDRMGFFLPALTEEKFEVQRETVKNERAQRIDNRPYGRMGERFDQAFYPQGHPYSWPVIGWPEDLDRADVEDVKHFFQRWYGPNNATLTIGGDFDEMQALAWVNQYFGEIPAGPEVKAPVKTLVTLDKTLYLSMEDRVHLPLIKMAMPTVYARHEDEPALDLLSNILGGGKTSIFYKNLVKDGYAVQAGVSHPCQELACQFSMYALANPAQGGTLADLEKIMRDSVTEFEQRGVTDDDLEKVKVNFEAATIFGLQSVQVKVSSLAFNETFSGNPNMIGTDLARYANVTKEDVMRVFNKYIKDKPMVVMSVVPQGQKQLIAKADNFVAPTEKIAAVAVQDLNAAPQITSAFDRNVVPPVGAAPVLKIPTLWQGKLANDIEVIGTETNETPTVEVVVYLNGGHRVIDIEQAGLASITASMMNESSLKRSSEELTQALEMLGSNVSFGASGYQSRLQISSLTENLDATMKIVQEKLFEPAFNQADFDRVKQQVLQNLQRQLTEPNYLASRAFSTLLYGDKSPFGVSSGGSIASVTAISLDDVKAFYKRQYTAGNAQIVAVGNLNEAQMLSKLTGLNGWTGVKTSFPELAVLPEFTGGKIYIVDKPEAAQSVIKIGKRALPYDATGTFFKSYLMNYPLGGAFNSRINLNLREDKGYTYGARSFFSGGPEQGFYQATASVRSDVTTEALVEFIKEINGFQATGMTEDELSFMQNSISQSKALNYETPYQKAGLMRNIQRYNLDDNYSEQQTEITNNITLDELNLLAKSQLKIDDMLILVVGDRAKIESELSTLGYPIEVLQL
ncbi:peptidase M16 [Shewanella sp. Choline-02u-19]|uniref:M16 family metallopeptidase n=1 Tax=unclassified Shewanella TaxID=196818 RepID=UPI000C3303F3|nr:MULTISPECIES: pitrilysin family protein [unclassified Shewanella]PKH57427.1 peptidase M16 [Shewanella sp. Bg11-22]PKI28272.1 peptidase M16 [Shewanella sp. Choline-02u-19]